MQLIFSIMVEDQSHIYHDAIISNFHSGNKEKHTGSVFDFRYTLLDIKVEKETRGSFQSLKSSATFVVLQGNFPPPYLCTNFQFHFTAYGDL